MIDKIFDFIIHQLGGYTAREYADHIAEQSKYIVDAAQKLERSRAEFSDSLTYERERYNKLQDIFFKKLGIIPAEISTQMSEANLEPIHTARKPWNQVRHALEKKDREKAHEAARPQESVKAEEYWTKKVEES